MSAGRKYHHGNLRTALIDEGLKLIAEKGARALTLREIGTRVGVSRMAAYRHFADKEDLLGAICEAGFEQFAGALEEARSGASGAFPERLRAMGIAYVRFALENPAYFEVMFGGAGVPLRSGEYGPRAFGILVETIVEGQVCGHVRGGDPVMLAQIVWAQVHGMATLHLAEDVKEGGEGRALLDLSSDVLLAGLARPPHTPTA